VAKGRFFMERIAMTVRVTDMVAEFRGWTPNTELLRLVGFRDLGAFGTAAGEIEVEEILPSVESDEPDVRMTAARVLYVASHRLSLDFTKALEGLVILARDPDQGVMNLARSALQRWERHPEVLWPMLATREGRRALNRIGNLVIVRKAVKDSI